VHAWTGDRVCPLTEEAAMTSSTLQSHTGGLPTVVLVHGAFADSSSWNGVIAQLRRDGYPVIGVANPLRALHTATPSPCGTSSTAWTGRSSPPATPTAAA
jgi:pimeloyl-ACP methyl ester carboxylesterase